MRQVAITRIGGPDALALRQAPDPEPGPGQVRVRVRASGVNFADILMRMGMYPGAPAVPFVPGYEAAGEIDRVGEGVALRPGDRVVAPTDFGGYSDTLVVPADQVFPIPAGRSYEEAAALTVNYLTAYLALVEHGRLRKGERVLVHMAAGGVGMAAAQICRVFDAEVFGTASPAKHAALREQGVRHCIDYRTQDFEAEVRRATGGEGVHVALDPVGGASFAKSYRSLAKGGRLICYGFSAAASGPRANPLRVAWQWLRTPRFSPFDMMLNNRSVVGLHLGRMKHDRELLMRSMAELVRWWSEGRLAPVVGARFPAAEAGRAHDYIQARSNVGKVILTWD